MLSIGTFRERQFWTVVSGLLPPQAMESRSAVVFGACGFMLVWSLLLGGGTRGGFLSDVVLELAAIPAFLLALSSLIDLPRRRLDNDARAYWALAFCSAIMLLPLIQLVPLPPWLWTRLPGRERIVAVFDLLGGRRPWMPISVSPSNTWMSFLSLLPPMAIFLGTIQLGYRERRGLTLIVIAVGVVGAFVGLTQVAQGPGSPLRFFAFTNNTEAVGFFANRNHFAALLYALLLFAAAWAIDVAVKIGPWSDAKRLAPGTVAAVTASAMVLVVFIAAEAVARSRAGLALTIVALAGAFALAYAGRTTRSAFTARKVVLTAVALAAIVVVQFSLYRILDRFTGDPLEDARIPFAHNTIRAAMAFMPLGAGLGTFVPVYAMFEKPSDTFANIYANHAHNDILELWLETGVIGMALLGLFVLWVGFNFVRLWRTSPAHASALDCSLVRAATLVILLLIAHSFVDYPLRTGAMMAILAFSCALLLEPLPAATSETPPARQTDRYGAPREPAVATDAVASANYSRQPPLPSSQMTRLPANPPPPGGRWGEGMDWPAEWRNAKGQEDNEKG